LTATLSLRYLSLKRGNALIEFGKVFSESGGEVPV
jgi:hypothetical protein